MWDANYFDEQHPVFKIFCQKNHYDFSIQSHYFKILSI